MTQAEKEAYVRFTESIEKWLIRAIAVLAVLLLASQALLTWPGARALLTSVDRLEGAVYKDELRLKEQP